MTVDGPTIRFGAPSDLLALSRLEREFFPAVEGEYHAGYLFESELAHQVLVEEIAAPRRAFTIVAELAGEIIGFAAAVPSRFPGTGQPDPSSMLLMHVAVVPDKRRLGVGATLLEEIERRCVAARQNLILAHVATSGTDFYRKQGWTVLGEGLGFAWVPFRHHLMADLADPQLGYPLMAVKILRPKAIRYSFEFPVTTAAPVADAVRELTRRIDNGHVSYLDFDQETRDLLELARGPRRVNAFGIG